MLCTARLSYVAFLCLGIEGGSRVKGVSRFKIKYFQFFTLVYFAVYQEIVEQNQILRKKYVILNFVQNRRHLFMFAVTLVRFC